MDGQSLTVADLVAVARGGEPVELTVAARAHMLACRAIVGEVLEPPAGSIYGFTTGVGVRRGAPVAPSAAR